MCSIFGYDAIEQFRPNGEVLSFEEWRTFSPYDKDLIFDKPRIITTSNSKNINIRFYNYLLMDWAVNVLPRYVYDDHTKKFVLFESFQLDTDKDYEDEIKSIKRLVPLRERTKYFR